MHLVQRDEAFRHVSPAFDASEHYQPVSYWQETIPAAPCGRLSTNTQCDVAVAGGGYTGLSTAIELKRRAPGMRVVLLERDVCGHGASGRNGGFVMPLLGWDLTDCVRRLGMEEARRAYRLTYRAVAHVKRQIKEAGIDCDLEETGYVLLATCPARVSRLRHEAQLGQDLDFDFRWLEGAALREFIHSARFLGGIYDPHPCAVNPAKLIHGLKQRALQLGVEIYERTPMRELHDGKQIRIVTEGGDVTAGKVVLALNGYSAAAGFTQNRVLPVHTFIVLTEPLTDAQLESIGWARRRASLETARNFIHYFRLTAGNRILFGGEDVALYWRGRHCDRDEAIEEALKRRFREYFPALEGVAFTHAWGGVLGVGLDMFPTLGVSGRHQNIFHACAYAGHGVALGNYAGKLLAPRVLGEKAEHADPAEKLFFGRTPAWLPPEPLRYTGMQTYRRLLHWQDWWQGA